MPNLTARQNKINDICHMIVVVIAMTIMATSIAVLFGWMHNIDALTRISSAMPSMKVNTAICFLLCGFTLYILANNFRTSFACMIAALASTSILLICMLTLAEYLFQVDFGIDQYFVVEKPLSIGTLYPGRSAVITLVCFIFASITFLYVIVNRTLAWWTQGLTWIIFVLCLFSLSNYINSVDLSYSAAQYMAMAIHTIVLFMLLSLGILLLKPDKGLIELLLRDSQLGYFLRYLTPVILILPMILVIIENIFEKSQLFDANFGDTITSVGTLGMFSIVVILVARRLDREELKMQETRVKLEQSELVFREFAEKIDIVFFKISPEYDEIYYVNAAYEKIWGKSVESLYEKPMSWFDSVIPEDQQAVYKAVHEDLKVKPSVSQEFRIKKADGSIRYISSHAFQIRDQHDVVFCISGILIDVTAEMLNKKNMEGYQKIVRILESSTSINDAAHQIIQVVCNVFGWDLGELWLVDEKSQSLRCDEIWHINSEKMIKFSNESETYVFKIGEGFPGKIWKEKKALWISDYSSRPEFTGSRKAELAALNSAFGVPIIYHDKVIGVMAFLSFSIQQPNSEILSLMENIGHVMGEFISRAHSDEQLQHISRHDLLTGALNRSALEDEVDHLIADPETSTIAIMLVDIDKFKMINDVYGHDQGDIFLKDIATRLSAIITSEAMGIARLGADIFILYYNVSENGNSVAEFIHRIERTLKKPFKLNEIDLNLSSCIGVALYPKDGMNCKTLIANADAALSHAKKINKGSSTVYFTEDLMATALDAISMQMDLRQAATKNQFILNFQPQIELTTGLICGAEALIRWQHPVKGLISPAEFITIAEEAGIISSLNEFILSKVFDFVGPGWSGPPISVNISAEQLQNNYRLAEFLESLIKEYGVNPKFIELEITESMLMDDVVHSIALLSALNHLGFNIAIDDFGTGYSSFSYLSRIPSQKIKIDKSFIHGLPGNEVNAEIVKSMIAMLHILNKKIVAEGAETKDEVDYLKKVNCDAVQGYYYHKPMSAQDFMKLVEKSKLPNNRTEI